MTGASSLAYPAGKTLAGWWRQMQGAGPHALWVGYLFVHRVEALVDAVQNKPLDRLHHFVLQALELQPAVAGPALLPLGEALTGQLLRALAQEGLVERAGEAWTLSERGKQALALGQYPARAQERRIFSFVEHVDAACQRLGLPKFIPLGPGPAAAWPAQEPYRLDIAWLRDCFAQSAEWKDKVGFPAGVNALLEASWTSNGKAEPAWKRIILDRPERLLMVFAAQGENPEMIQGYAVKPEGWSLYTSEPILRLPRLVAADMIPALLPLPDQVWHTAWAAWCGTRHLPAEDIHACKVTPAGPRLRITAPAALLQRLRAARSEVFKGETWLLAGEGHVRAAAMVEVGEG